MTPGFLPATSPRVARRRAVVAWTFVGVQALLLAGIVVAPRDDSWQLSQFVPNPASIRSKHVLLRGKVVQEPTIKRTSALEVWV